MEQLSLDFNSSVTSRRKKEIKRIKKAADELKTPTLFEDPISIDISLSKPGSALAIFSKNYDKTLLWLTSIVGPCVSVKKNQVTFPSEKIVKLLYVRPPNIVTLDSSALALARILVGESIGLKPVIVKKTGRRLVVQTPKQWPSKLKIVDGPFTTILHLVKLNINFSIDPLAFTVFEKKILETQTPLASARIAGSMVIISTNQPNIIERLNLPGLSYLNGEHSGLFKLPVLNAKILLETPQIQLSQRAKKIIKKTTTSAKPVGSIPNFPWTLYPFQSIDVGKSLKILETTGGVLLAAEMGAGKALHYLTNVKTIKGLTPIKDLTLSDKIQGKDGLYYDILGIYPQGVRKLYKIRIQNPVSNIINEVSCDIEHIWGYKFEEEVRDEFTLHKTGTTKDLINLLNSHKIYIPFLNNMCGKVLSITETLPDYAYCIKTDAPSELFCLENDILTHNTTMALALTELKNLSPILVIAPLSAFSTWLRQLKDLNKETLLATGKPSVIWEELRSKKYQAVVLSYDRLPMFMEAVEDYGFKVVIVDEIQRIRTPSSRRSRSLRQLATHIPNRIGLSGTPLTNTVNDLLPVGSFLVPSEWPARASSKTLEDLYPNDPIEQIAEHLGSIMVRRKMTEVGAKLPKRHDHRILVDLTMQQRKALQDLQDKTKQEAAEGFFADKTNRMHAFAKLQMMRQIINTPSLHNVKGGNPKVDYAIELAQSFINANRKGVIFCADRTSFKEIGERLTQAGIEFVEIWGSTPPLQRIAAEKQFHNDPETKIVLCTIQAGSESWSASPTATFLICTSYMYAPSILSQMEARVYRMNSDPNGPDIDICYLHASSQGGTLDDRMVEILESKKQLFAQVVDRSKHVDSTKLHYSMDDLMYLLTGNSPYQNSLMTEVESNVVTKINIGKSKTSVKKFKVQAPKNKDETFESDSSITQGDLFADTDLDSLSY